MTGAPNRSATKSTVMNKYLGKILRKSLIEIHGEFSERISGGIHELFLKESLIEYLEKYLNFRKEL